VKPAPSACPSTAPQRAPRHFEGRSGRAFCALVLLLTLGFGASPWFLGLPSAAEPRVAQDAEKGHDSAAGEAQESGGWGATFAKALNFIVLAGALGYLLRTPAVGYLRTREETIRRGLTEAAALKSSSEAQLAQVRTRLSALPAELEALRRRGDEELAGERARLAEATAREKQRLIDRTRREIDLQFRIARRQLLEHSAELAIRLARTRIERVITAEDQTRLIDQYAAEVRA
jgi:F-type H+-transporting ATPase subunit b